MAAPVSGNAGSPQAIMLVDPTTGVPYSLSGIYSGTGSPLNVLVAPVGSLYRRTDGGANTTLYVKESGTDASGWVAK
jgi:hypothetical protein